MENSGGDAPFGGRLVDRKFPGEDLFEDRQTDRIMAFDAVLPLDPNVPETFDHRTIRVFEKSRGPVAKVRRLALFEGTDEFGPLQRLLGTAEAVQDATGAWVDGAIAWASPTTENPDLGAGEIWEIYNATGDAHPIHLHLVHFEVQERWRFKADVLEQPVLQHNGEYGNGFRLENVKAIGGKREPEHYERAPKDTVTALPGEVTRIRMTSDKPGRFVWHCHILSHEDHEMMRVLHVGPGA